VNNTNPCEQTSIAWRAQATAPAAMRRNSHPPMMTAARPAAARAAVPLDRGLREAPAGEVPGAGPGAAWDAGTRGRVAGSAGASAGGAAADLTSVGASTAVNGVVAIW
jgi:hypothetical protein